MNMIINTVGAPTQVPVKPVPIKTPERKQPTGPPTQVPIPAPKPSERPCQVPRPDPDKEHEYCQNFSVTI